MTFSQRFIMLFDACELLLCFSVDNDYPLSPYLSLCCQYQNSILVSVIVKCTSVFVNIKIPTFPPPQAKAN